MNNKKFNNRYIAILIIIASMMKYSMCDDELKPLANSRVMNLFKLSTNPEPCNTADILYCTYWGPNSFCSFSDYADYTQNVFRDCPKGDTCFCINAPPNTTFVQAGAGPYAGDTWVQYDDQLGYALLVVLEKYTVHVCVNLIKPYTIGTSLWIKNQ